MTDASKATVSGQGDESPCSAVTPGIEIAGSLDREVVSMNYSAFGQHTANGERLDRDGRVFITRGELAVLQGLFDRPGGMAVGRVDAGRATAAHGYARNPKKALPCEHRPEWVEHGRQGRRKTYRLTDRAREILDGKVRVHLLGVGPWAPRSARAGRPPEGQALPGA